MTMIDLLQIECEAQPFRGMANRSLRLMFDSQENQSDEVLGKVASFTGKHGWLVFLPGKRILPEQVASLPELTDEDGGKSPAARLRGCLYVLWEQRGKEGEFELFYRLQLEKFINAVKEKLN